MKPNRGDFRPRGAREVLHDGEPATRTHTTSKALASSNAPPTLAKDARITGTPLVDGWCGRRQERGPAK